MRHLDLIKEMQKIYQKFDHNLAMYESKHGSYYIKELLGEISVLGCCLSELEALMENDQ